MTIYSSTFFTNWYATNGIQKNWEYDFAIFDPRTVVVQVRDNETGSITEHTTNFGFYPNSDNNGYVQFPQTGEALPTGGAVRLVRRVGYTQEIEIGNEGSFEPMLHERAFDMATMQIQQIYDESRRGLRVPLGGAGGEVKLGPAGNLVKFTADGGLGDTGTTVDGVAINAATSVTARNEAVAARDIAVPAKDTAVAKAGEAVAARDLAAKWASNPENVEVVAGMYSAYHWATKAAAWVIEELGYVIHGSPAKASPVDADEFVLADSAGSAWGAAKITWAQFKAAMKSYLDTLYVPQGRTISTTGLLTGGNTLAANRTFNVQKSSEAQARAGTDDTTALTPVGGLNQINQFTLGLEQSWSDASSLRTHGVAYQNTTGKPIMVSVTARSSNTTYRWVQVSSNESSWISIGRLPQNSHINQTVNAVIPPNHYYRVDAAIVEVTWAELS